VTLSQSTQSPDIVNTATDSVSAAGRKAGGPDVLFAVVLGLLSTFLAYRFGSGNQLEQIPIVLRQLDPTYLTGDFFVSTSVEFGPRIYFARMVASVARLLPLPWTYAALTFLSDLALILVTMWAARRIVGTDRVGAAIAAALTLVVSSFHLGDATDLRYDVFQPASLGVVGMLFAIGLGWQGRPAAAALVASIASLSHPLYGVQGGAIALVTAFFVLLVPETPRQSRGERRALAWRNAIVQTAIGGLVLAGAVLVFWWLPYQGSRVAALSTEELFAIIARFRSPHHYFPSQFRPQDYLTTALFCVSTWMAFELWSRSVSRRTARLFLVPVLLVAVGCIAGTLFTEVWPLGVVLTLQPFRLLSIVKWVGYLLIGWTFERYLRTEPRLARPIVGLSLLSAGGTFPLVTTAGLGLLRVRGWLPSRVNPFVWVAALALAAAGLWSIFGSVDEKTRLVAVMTLLVIFSQSRRTIHAVGTLATLVFVGAIVMYRTALPAAPSPLQPLLSGDDFRDADAGMARAASLHTPADAVFVVPPNFGILRLVGQRALVVDFKSIPFQDQHMREWRERIRQVYGEVSGGGVEASRELEDSYRAILDAHLNELAARYGATHAVLFSETPTMLPILASNESYRLVRLISP
jgi:hypothetical protein